MKERHGRACRVKELSVRGQETKQSMPALVVFGVFGGVRRVRARKYESFENCKFGIESSSRRLFAKLEAVPAGCLRGSLDKRTVCARGA